jgi:hypothetical protein
MKAVFEFELPEDREVFEMHVLAVQYAAAIEAVKSAFRAKDKYLENPATTWNEARQLLLDTLNEALG